MTLPTDCQVHQIKVVTAFLKVGIPLKKNDCFRDLLEENSTHVVGRRSLCDLIPFVRDGKRKQFCKRLRVKSCQ